MPYSNKERGIALARKWALNNPDRAKLARRRWRWKNQGMNPDKAQTIYESISNCEICGIHVEGKNKHVDHNKKTGFTRGILCGNCNALLGHAKEDTNILSEASKYLARKASL
jgi:hypothetical protein